MADRRISTGTLTAIADAIRAKTGSSAAYTPAQMAAAIGTIRSREDFAWHQCPEAVRNYLANVDYDGVPYTESSIGDYAPTPAVPATNTKPIGRTVDGVTFCNTRPNGNAPYATANQSGVLNPLDQVRWIRSATANMRDLGGWPCDGGTVKYGLLYRSGELNAQDEDLLINQLGITVECDLTADGEAAYPGKMRFIGHTSYAMYSLANTEAWQVNLRGIFDAVRYGDPVVFHCSMGADRTGTLACILEGLLGVSQSDIDKDYELTSFYALRARNGNYQGGTTDWAHLIAQIEALSGDTFRDKVVGFVLGLGFTAEDINAFRHAMIDGTPEDITEPTQANLFDPNDSDVALRCRINSSGAAVAYADGQLVTGFITGAVGDTFVVETDKSLITNGYTGAVACYTSEKAYIAGIVNGSSTVWTFSNSDMTGTCTIPSTLNGKDYTGTAYVRFCVAYTDINNIKIYKQ